MNGLIAGYAIVVGIFMIGFWGVLVATGQAELQERPWDMRLHLAAEFSTAALLLIAGVGSFLGLPGVPVLGPVALGKLLYTVINSPGFYAGKGDRSMVGMFAILAVVTAAAITALVLLGGPWSQRRAEPGHRGVRDLADVSRESTPQDFAEFFTIRSSFALVS